MAILRPLKSQSFRQWEIAQLARHETVNTRIEHCSSRVKSSIPVRGHIFAEFICYNTILTDLTE